MLRFVKNEYPDVELIRPEMSIFAMAKKKKILPTMTMRWCCAEFKEKGGIGKVCLVGVRREESARRKKRGEISGKVKGERIEMTFDQWEEHRENMVTCVGGKDKIIVCPILYWTEKDVWDFLNGNGLPHCSLYDEGYKRIGCICCPMSSRKSLLRDIEKFPHVKRNWIETIRYMKEHGFMGYDLSPEDGFDWWISKRNFKEFYADRFLQGKFDFK